MTFGRSSAQGGLSQLTVGCEQTDSEIISLAYVRQVIALRFIVSRQAFLIASYTHDSILGFWIVAAMRNI